jgi:lantibiotic biosynthesis dehydratase-like protein
VRYARRGEHLKIRLHGSPELQPVMKRLLAEAAEGYFASLGAPEVGAPRVVSKKSPPIDPEDIEEGVYPDRSLLWTMYRRSHISLGSEPFLLEDRYVALFTRCLAAGCRRTLEALQPDGSGRVSPSVRPSTLLKLLIEGLSGLGFSEEQRLQYLAYHRDWLIRFTLLKNQADLERAEEAIAQFDRRLQAKAGQVEATQRKLSMQGAVDPAWRHALAEFWQHARFLCKSPNYHIDSFASDPAFACIFKVLHGLGNQLGITPLDEAFVHHLLLRAVEMEQRPPVTSQIDGDAVH